MLQLVYVSATSEPMTHSDLHAILDASRAKNRVLGITGMLLHIDQSFMQVLEGPRDAVLSLFSSIQRDPRHIGVRLLVQRSIKERLFDGWTMGFERLSPGDPDTTDVFEITREAIEGVVAPEKAAEIAVLLRNFYRVNAGECAA